MDLVQAKPQTIVFNNQILSTFEKDGVRFSAIWQAAAPDKSLAFLLVGAAPLLVAVLAYTGYAYWVFRGKTPADHHGY